MFFFLILSLSMVGITETSFISFTGPAGSEGKKVKKSELQLFNGKNLDGWYTFIKDRGKNVYPEKQGSSYVYKPEGAKIFFKQIVLETLQ